MSDALRRAGYRILGSRFDYVLHLRPAEWPIMATHTLLGALLAVGVAGWPHLLTGRFLAGVVAWVVCLNGATLAINSAYDRDEGDVAYLRRPPPPPPGLVRFSIGLFALGGLLAVALPRPYLLAYVVCLVLSVLYSVPPFRLKAVAGMDWFINMWGFGTITPFAGWALTGVPLTAPGRLVLLGFCPLFAALYPLTQLYQLEEDRARGDRTLASVLGVGGSLVASLACATVAFALLALGGVEAGWGPLALDGRWRLLGAAGLAWMIVLVPWLVAGRAWQAARHQRGMYHALAAWAITDLAVLLAWGR